MKVVFFGTTQFSVAILSHLIASGVNVVGVVSKPAKMQGRNQQLKPTPVSEFVKKNYPDLPLLCPVKISDPEGEEKLKELQADIFVVVAFGEIIKQNILDLPKVDCINIHASLLPKYRGAAPIHRAIMNGEKESGVTIMKMVKALDAGDMIHVEKVSIRSDMTMGDLESELREVGKKGIIEVLKQFKKKTVTYTPQKDSEATYAHKITVEECRVDFEKQGLELERLILGVTPFPGAWCEVLVNNQKKRLKLKKVSYIQGLTSDPKCLIQYENNEIIVACRTGAIQIHELQLEGKQKVKAKDFILGYPSISFL